MLDDGTTEARRAMFSTQSRPRSSAHKYGGPDIERVEEFKIQGGS